MAETPWLAASRGVRGHRRTGRALTENLDGAVARFPDRVALDFLGATTTYAQLGDQVARAAEALRAIGVRSGDRVALILPNCPQHVVAFYAVLRLGAVAVEHNPLYTADELAHQLADHGATVAICWEKVAATVAATADRTSVTTIVGVDLIAAAAAGKRLALKLSAAAGAQDAGPRCGVVAGRRAPWRRWSRRRRRSPIPFRDRASATRPVAVQRRHQRTPKGAILTHKNAANRRAGPLCWCQGSATEARPFTPCFRSSTRTG